MIRWTPSLVVAVALLTARARAQETTPTPSAPSVMAVAPSAAPVAPQPAPYAPPPYSSAPPLGMYRREILFDATSADAVLELEQYGSWRSVCTGSCRTMAAVGSRYRVGGDGVSNSKAFVVHSSPNPVVVHADAGSSSTRSGGLVMTIVGGATMVVGIVFLTLRAACVSCSSADRSQERRQAVEIGVPVIAVGAGAVAGGIILMVSNRTRLDFAPGAEAWTPRVKLGKGFELSAEGVRF